MDPQWKNQNQGNDDQPPSAQPASTPGQTISPQPTQQLPPNPTPAQPGSNQPVGYDEFASQNVYGQASSPVSVARKVVVMITVFTLLVIPGIGGAYFLFGKDKPESKQASETPAQQAPEEDFEEKKIEVPASWKPVETEFGFVVKAPDGWSGATLPLDFDVNGIKGQSISIADPTATTTGFNSTSVTIGTQTINESKTQAEFESYMTDADKSAKPYTDFGISKDEIKITSKKLNIKGKEWLQVDTEIPGQFTTAMYLWNVDHAISLTVLGKDKTEVEKLVNDYLYPMTASVELRQQ